MGSGCGISRMAGLTLYGSSTCPLSQSVHMTLDLLKLSYTYIEVNTDASGKHDLIAINPHNTVPVLVDDSLVITESSAAMTYPCYCISRGCYLCTRCGCYHCTEDACYH